MARAGFFRLWSQIERLRPEGFEPPTYGSEDRCSVQLSYGRKLLFIFDLRRFFRHLSTILYTRFYTRYTAESGRDGYDVPAVSTVTTV